MSVRHHRDRGKTNESYFHKNVQRTINVLPNYLNPRTVGFKNIFVIYFSANLKPQCILSNE
jgi:hypothetical protein